MSSPPILLFYLYSQSNFAIVLRIGTDCRNSLDEVRLLQEEQNIKIALSLRDLCECLEGNRVP